MSRITPRFHLYQMCRRYSANGKCVLIPSPNKLFKWLLGLWLEYPVCGISCWTDEWWYQGIYSVQINCFPFTAPFNLSLPFRSVTIGASRVITTTDPNQALDRIGASRVALLLLGDRKRGGVFARENGVWNCGWRCTAAGNEVTHESWALMIFFFKTYV